MSAARLWEACAALKTKKARAVILPHVVDTCKTKAGRMAENKNDLGAAIYHAAEYRTPRRAIALEHGWLAAVLLDHLHSLEGHFATQRIEADGRLWFYRARHQLTHYLGCGRDAYETAMGKLERAGFVHRRMMKGAALSAVNHWSVDLSPMEEKPPTVMSDGGKPANAMAGNPPTVGVIPLLKRTNTTTHHPEPSVDTSRGLAAQVEGAPQAPQPGVQADGPKAKKAQVVPPDVQAIWSHYLQAMGKSSRCSITGKFGNTRLSRLAGIKAWLKQETDEGPNTVEKAKRLIDGLSRSQHHRQQGYDCISYALRPNNEKRFLGHLTASQGHVPSDTVDADAWLKGLGLK